MADDEPTVLKAVIDHETISCQSVQPSDLDDRQRRPVRRDVVGVVLDAAKHQVRRPTDLHQQVDEPTQRRCLPLPQIATQRVALIGRSVVLVVDGPNDRILAACELEYVVGVGSGRDHLGTVVVKVELVAMLGATISRSSGRLPSGLPTQDPIDDCPQLGAGLLGVVVPAI